MVALLASVVIVNISILVAQTVKDCKNNLENQSKTLENEKHTMQMQIMNKLLDDYAKVSPNRSRGRVFQKYSRAGKP